MRRPFLGPALGFAVGILLGRSFSFPETSLFFLIFFLLPFLWFLRGRRLFLPLFVLALAAMGMLRIHQAFKLPAHHISYFAHGDWVSLEGRVISLPELKEKGKRRIYSFLLQSENLVRRKEFFEVTGKVQIFLFNPGEQATYGSRVRLRGKLAPPKTPRNPGEFDYRNYLADQGIYAVFEGYGARSLRVLERKVSFLRRPLAAVQKLREVSSRRFDRLFPLPLNALLKALVLGIRKDLPEEFRDDFVKTGTAHLIAISGMNITLVAGSLFFLSLCLGFPQKAAACVGLFSTLTYVFLSGAGIPVVRAGWMAGLFFVGLLLEREKDLLNSLFFALFAILAFDPKALFQVGFQLSFLSVFSLLLLTPRHKLEGVGDSFQTAVVMIGTFPLCVVYFNVFSWVSLLANLLAIPLFHLGNLGGLGSLLGGEIPFLGPFLTALTSLVLKAGLSWIHFWGQKPWGYFHLSPPPWKLVFFYYSALALILITSRYRSGRFSALRPLAVSLWLLTAVSFFLPRRSPHFVLTALAAGSNELLHVEFPGRNHWLVNTGRGKPASQARWILNPFLRRAGVNHLEGVLLTDFSRRHVGGFSILFNNFSIGSVLFPGPQKLSFEGVPRLNSANWKRTIRTPLRAGDQIPIQKEAGFRILEVAEGQVFLLIYYQEKKFLLLPTWKTKILERVLPRLKEIQFVDVLMVPARGEPSSFLWKEVLSSTKPHWVVFSRRSPALEPLLETLRKGEISFFFLAETGALRFEIQKGRFLISPFLLNGKSLH